MCIGLEKLTRAFGMLTLIRGLAMIMGPPIAAKANGLFAAAASNLTFDVANGTFDDAVNGTFDATNGTFTAAANGTFGVANGTFDAAANGTVAAASANGSFAPSFYVGGGFFLIAGVLSVLADVVRRMGTKKSENV